MDDKTAKELVKELKKIRKELEKQNNVNIVLPGEDVVNVIKPEGSS